MFCSNWTNSNSQSQWFICYYRTKKCDNNHSNDQIQLLAIILSDQTVYLVGIYIVLFSCLFTFANNNNFSAIGILILFMQAMPHSSSYLIIIFRITTACQIHKMNIFNKKQTHLSDCRGTIIFTIQSMI